MSLTATPFGMLPTVRLGSAYNTQGFNTYRIASAYNTSIRYGDVVKLVTDGTVEKDTGTTALTPLGVFLGCEYTIPGTLNYRVWSQMWPANTVDTTAFAYVLDDLGGVFRMQANGAVTQAALGANAAIVQGTGSDAFGISRNSLNAASIATTNTLPLRIVGFYEGPSSAVGDAFTDLLVKFNAGVQLANTTGI